MKKLLLLIFAFCLLSITGCASKTTYIEIQEPTQLYMYGKPVHSVQPGDVLRVVESKTCRSGRGTCWWVRNDKDGYGGIVNATEMKTLHKIYKVEKPDE